MKEKTPLITIVGVPNTGKSTLFNRLIGKRKALIHAEPGMTRDIYQYPVEIMGCRCLIQDSGGFFPDDQTIGRAVNTRILKEAERSDLVIFLFDGKRELLGYERDLYLELKRKNIPIIPVVNKVDHPEKFVLSTDYYALKLDYVQISAEHNSGIGEMLERISRELDLESRSTEPQVVSGKDATKISVVGKTNVGKSSIINRVFNDERVIVSPIPGTTRDSVDLNIRINKKDFILVDNAGIRKLHKVKEDTESAAVLRAGSNIKRADIVVFVVDISKKLDRNDLFIARKIVASAKPVIIACNKWDLIPDKTQAGPIMMGTRRRFNFLYFASMLLVSAKTGKNIPLIINRVEQIQERLKNPVKTAQLNQVISEIIGERKLRTLNNKPFNPKYCVIESLHPFFIRFFSGSGARLTPASEIYLKKRIIRQLDLEGIPVFLKMSPRKNR